jgi:hypothetical protein
MALNVGAINGRIDVTADIILEVFRNAPMKIGSHKQSTRRIVEANTTTKDIFFETNSITNQLEFYHD